MLIAVMWAVAPQLKAQGDAMLTHYWAVPTYYNPAAAGDTDHIRLRGGMRAQWVGIDNAPRTFVGAADSPFRWLGKRWGAGVVVQQESYGLFRNLTADVQLGYKHRALKGEFTIAVQAGLFNEQFKGSEVYIPDDDDYIYVNVASNVADHRYENQRCYRFIRSRDARRDGFYATEICEYDRPDSYL